MLPPRPASEETNPSFVRWTQGMINRLVSVSDLVLLLLAAGLAHSLMGLVPQGGLSPLQLLVVALLQIVAFGDVMWRVGAYRVEHYTDRAGAAFHVLGALLPAWAISAVLLGAFAPALFHNPNWLILWHVLQVLLLLLGRELQRVLIHLAERRRLLRRRVVIVGANPVAARVIADLSATHDGGYEVLAVFRDTPDDRMQGTIAGVPVEGDLETLSHYAQTRTIDIVVLALPWSRAPEIFRLTGAVSWIAADVVIPFDDSDEQATAPSFAAVAPLGHGTALQVMSRPFKGTQGVLKVFEDYVVASIALVFLSPLMLIAALAIRLEGPGPILFRQWRPGFGTKPFAIYKFRTMRVDPHDDATIGTTGRRDPRITRVGAVLRKLSIDELPQLFNVLKGEMSVVGPRPYVANMLVGNERFSDLVKQYAERHRIKPGLTGYAQAHGMRSFALRSPENARRSIEMDVHYMTHWSLWLDFKIMLRTLVVGLAGRNVF